MNAVIQIQDTRFEFGNLSSSALSQLPKEMASFLQEWLSDQNHFEIPTSGTTGDSKNVKVNRKDMEKSAMFTMQYLDLKKGNSMLHCLPCSFIAGKMMLVRGLLFNMHIHVVEPSANPLLNVGQPIDFMAITPHQLSTILLNSETSEKLKHISKVIIGGGPVSQIDLKTIENFPNEIYHTYGMTETLSNIAMQKLNRSSDHHRIFTIIDDSFRLSADVRHCLVIQSPFEHLPQIVTNDVVELINPRQFQWLGRIDDLINSGGIKLLPVEMESALTSQLSMRFFISGIPDEKYGEVAALIIEDQIWNPERIRWLSELIKKSFPDGKKRPRKVGFVNPFLVTETSKIRRKATSEMVSVFKDI